jgi:hypothetical protein
LLRRALLHSLTHRCLNHKVAPIRRTWALALHEHSGRNLYPEAKQPVRNGVPKMVHKVPFGFTSELPPFAGIGLIGRPVFGK